MNASPITIKTMISHNAGGQKAFREFISRRDPLDGRLLVLLNPSRTWECLATTIDKYWTHSSAFSPSVGFKISV